MSEKARARKSVLDRVLEGELTQVEASKLLGLSYRQLRRVYRRFVKEGDAGLIHGNQDRPSHRRKPEAFRQAVLKRYRERYKGFGPTLASEKLAEEGYRLDHETLRRWLLSESLWTRKRKGVQHRQWRQPRGHFGELVQMDGSHHQWFGPDRPFCCLIDLVDDATGITLGHMAEEETTEAVMEVLWQWLERFGIPLALYTDRKNVFVTDREPTLEEQLAGKEPKTAFGKACEKLGIEIIAANSPQAKGRVERKHGVYQDRFVKELQLTEIDTLEDANALLCNGFLASLNRKFARPPREEADFHRPVPKELNLGEVFCWEKARVVRNDWTVRHDNHFYQIHKHDGPLPRPRNKITVRTLLDGTTQLVWQGHKLRFTEIEEASRPKAQGKPATRSPKKKLSGKRKPAADHPWKRSWK
jgi:hypothetical protein